ncbi:NAD(+)/NADH kinase [uncultured Roseibium sp.]|uniref:NAD(+)/NADH kinase n=1 Tax=uncultured Roseibium sp. TaxID=1936171 RepID=UPI002626AD68|nr:NAD(+)/NADH kinase [uncultured Roseibium sp.]
MSSLAPRVVIVTRQSEFQSLLASHGTRGQAAFFLQSREQDISEVETAHMALATAIQRTKSAVPAEWSIASVERDDLDRFLFTDNDIIVAVGQDGLVANLAKYCSGQPVIGVAPGQDGSEGILTSASPADVARLLEQVERNAVEINHRTMVSAILGTGETLCALNELFIGHRSHQSARYLIRIGNEEEYQSSSGVIVSTGTGATGWAKSIMTATHQMFDIDPTDRSALYFAREPWPSHHSGCELRSGAIGPGKDLHLTSRINDGGVVFADGIEQDFLRFDWGRRVSVSIADKTLNLVSAT